MNSLKEESSFRPIDSLGRVDVQNVDKHTAFAVIRKKEWPTVVYFLEKRCTGDSWSGHYGLFGGKQKEDEKSYESVLSRELNEELGIPAQDNDLISQHYFVSQRLNGRMTAKEIFRLENPHLQKYITTSKIKTAVEGRSKIDKDDLVGKPIKIRRIGSWWWFSDWHRLTPLAAYALLDDCAKDRRR